MYNGTRLNARDAEVLSQLVNGPSNEKMSVNTKLSVINILNKIASLSDGELTSRQKEDLSTTAASERFEFIEILGKGGMGTVYKARNKSTDMLVAVKVFKPTTTAAWQRFVQEASIMTKLSHASVVKVFDFLLDGDGTAYLVMEMVDGPSLMNVIDCGGAIVQREAVPIFVQCADALEHLHRAGVVHRDIKPSNIILFCEDESNILPKIVDFGVSKCMTLEASDRLTLQGEVLGSPLYMSPEQCRGEDVTHLSDIYSMGCVMFEVLSGCPPFVGESYFETMTMHSRSPVPNLREWMNAKHELSPELAAIIERCLAKSPADRYQSAEELATALHRIVTRL
jgi:serine/threonine-protein kinase